MCFDDERFLFIPADVQVYFSFYEYFSFLFCEFDWIYDFRAGVYPEPGPIGECDGRTPADKLSCSGKLDLKESLDEMMKALKEAAPIQIENKYESIEIKVKH